MKLLLSSLLLFGLASAMAYAQTTMPAIGANTPKGEVSKTDASVNQTAAGKRINTSSKTKTTGSKRMRKTNMKTTKTTDTM